MSVGKSFTRNNACRKHVCRLNQEREVHPISDTECGEWTVGNKTQKEAEKFFICRYCRKSYTRKYSLKCHLKKHAIPENPAHQSDSQTASAEDYVNQNHRASTEEQPNQDQIASAEEYFNESLLVSTQEYQIKNVRQPPSAKEYLNKRQTTYPNQYQTASEDENLSQSTCTEDCVNESVPASTEEYERNHKCPLCPKSFRVKSRLEVHLRKHSGEKPHECVICSEKFRRMKHWKKHVLKYHD